MGNIKRIILFLFLFENVSICLLQSSSNNSLPVMYEINKISRDIHFAQTMAQLKMATCVLVMMSVGYVHTSTCLEMLKQYPILFVAGSFFATNYIFDVVAKYRQINEAIGFFIFAQRFSCYVLALQAIQSWLRQRQVQFDTVSFECDIVRLSGYSLTALKQLAYDFLTKSVVELNHVKIDMGAHCMQSFVHIFEQDDVAIDLVLKGLSCQQVLHQKLLSFYNDVDQNYDEIIKFICQALHDQCCQL